MNKQLLKVIGRALRSGQTLFPLNQSWNHLHQHYNIGRTLGNKLEITPQDKDNLLALVKAENAIDLQHITVADLSAMNREDVLAVAMDEKLAGLAVKKDRLAMKAWTNKPLKINGKNYLLPDTGFLDLGLADVHCAAHSCILLIENFRCFDRLGAMRLDLPAQYADPLVLFRGDNYYHQQTVRQLLATLNLPVLVMADLDPQGLMIAQSFAAVAFIAPGLSDLEALFNDKQIANPQLYAQQLAACQTALANSPHILIRQLWQLMQAHQAGVVQEYGLQKAYVWKAHELCSGLSRAD